MPSTTAVRFVAAALAIIVATARAVSAQDADPLPTTRDSTAGFPNTFAGEFTPARGFDIVKTARGSLNISAYGLFRYMNQTPQGQTFTDHLGQVRPVNPRNDLNWHRTMVWLTGFFYKPQFKYNITLWSLPTTNQTLLFGNLQYTVNRRLTLAVGIAPSLTARSMQGSWPFWAASDRQMAEEFFRGGFSSGFFILGELAPRLTYTLTINNNISELGIPQSADTRDMLYGGSLRWQPTTGEFGPRGGFGDLEHHLRLATQFGASASNSREGRAAPVGQPPLSTQIKLSDGTNPFDLGALAPGVTVTSLKYREAAVDAGMKYRGFSFQSEYYWRNLSDFVATGFVPNTFIYDHGVMAEAGYMVVPKAVNLYVVSGYVWDAFQRHPWELGGGASYYPSGTRSWRLNLHLLHIDKSPTSSYFGYYLAGQTGTIFSLGTDILM